MQKQQESTALVWFRNDLRICDQQSLALACSNHKKVLAVYCFDPRHYQTTIYGFKKTERYRAAFLIQTVKELQNSLKKHNISLIVAHDTPEHTISALIKEYNITAVYSQKEWTFEETRIDVSLQENNPRVKWIASYDQFLFHPDDIPYESITAIPKVFTTFRKKCEKQTQVRPPIPPISVMPLENLLKQNTPIPTLESLSLKDFEKDTRTAFPFLGGEHKARQRIDHYFWQTKKLQVYKKTRNGLLGTEYSSKLSPWLANGSISARTVYSEIKKFETQIAKNQDTYWLYFELIWRDYFKYISLKYGNAIFKIHGILYKKYEWKDHHPTFLKWVQGKTADTFVNANMKELAQTGWMSNRGRQNVASYLAKELHEDWRKGAAYFESMLLDYDVHSNWGNWMYVSGVGNDPRDRKFNTKRQAERYDPHGKFQRLWLQEKLF
ncbi:DASH family cryptochrome [Ascidiimonas aurantiaca]|uniref:DASH family cryptochrome n=1 Tax=Ascidiimonas aurantiaca TaxID=1685432 RepID=UPI0030EC1743